MTTLKDYLKDNGYDDFDKKIRLAVKLWLLQKQEQNKLIVTDNTLLGYTVGRKRMLYDLLEDLK